MKWKKDAFFSVWCYVLPGQAFLPEDYRYLMQRSTSKAKTKEI